MSHHVRFNLKWFLLTFFVSITLFKVLVYPWLGSLEGKFYPVYKLEQHDVFNAEVGDTKYVGGVIESIRNCELVSLTFYNAREDGIRVLYNRDNVFFPVPYSIGTKTSFGLFTFKPDYFGESLSNLKVRTVSRCHPVWDTVTINDVKV